MILLPYALLLLALCPTGVFARPGGKKRKDRRPDDTPQAAASTSHAVSVSSKPQSLAGMTVDEILALRHVPLKQLDELKIINELSSDLWPPKIGGVYYTEPRNFVSIRSFYC